MVTQSPGRSCGDYVEASKGLYKTTQARCLSVLDQHHQQHPFTQVYYISVCKVAKSTPSHATVTGTQQESNCSRSLIISEVRLQKDQRLSVQL